MTIERLTTGDFIGRLPFQSGADRVYGGPDPPELRPAHARSSTCHEQVDYVLHCPRAADAWHASARFSDLRSQPCPNSMVPGYTVVGLLLAHPSAPITPIPWRWVPWADDATYVNTVPVVKLRASGTSAQYTLS